MEEEKKHKEEQAIALPQKVFEEIARLKSDEQKLDYLLSFMQETLEERGALHFREFWEARSLVLELFKAHLHPTDRMRLWTRYSELCQEAKQLKELFEEESSYITEQIEKAIEAVEKEMDKFEQHFSEESIKGDDIYNHLQDRLIHLNSCAARLSSLKKEITRSDIHPKHRHRILDRLRKIGDRVYPKRKEYVDQVSARFLEEVDLFIQKTFVDELSMHQLLKVRDRIKQLQKLAKQLTLSTKAFTKTRVQLNECWEGVKRALQEHKRVQHEQEKTFRVNRDELFSEIEQLQKEYEEGKVHESQAKKVLHRISARMRNLSLAHKDVKAIKEKVRSFEESFGQKEKKVVLAPDLRGKHKEKLLDRVRKLLEENGDLFELFEKLVDDADKIELTSMQRVELDQELVKVRDRIEEKAIRASKEETYSLLKRIWESSKDQLEIWRKVKGASSHDFTLEMAYSELIEQERDRLGRIELKMEEIES